MYWWRDASNRNTACPHAPCSLVITGTISASPPKVKEKEGLRLTSVHPQAVSSMTTSPTWHCMSAETPVYTAGWMDCSDRHQKSQRNRDQWSSAARSLPPVEVPEPRLLLLILLWNKIHPHYHWLHTHSLTLCPTRLGEEGGGQDVRPAGHQLRQRNLLNVLLHQNGCQTTLHCCVFKAHLSLFRPAPEVQFQFDNTSFQKAFKLMKAFTIILGEGSVTRAISRQVILLNLPQQSLAKQCFTKAWRGEEEELEKTRWFYRREASGRCNLSLAVASFSRSLGRDKPGLCTGNSGTEDGLKNSKKDAVWAVNVLDFLSVLFT